MATKTEEQETVRTIDRFIKVRSQSVAVACISFFPSKRKSCAASRYSAGIMIVAALGTWRLRSSLSAPALPVPTAMRNSGEVGIELNYLLSALILSPSMSYDRNYGDRSDEAGFNRCLRHNRKSSTRSWRRPSPGLRWSRRPSHWVTDRSQNPLVQR